LSVRLFFILQVDEAPKKKISEMTLEEKQQWLEQRKKEVAAKKAREELEVRLLVIPSVSV